MDKDFKEISDKLDSLRGVVDKHIESTIIYREAQSKTLDQHSKEIWGNGEPGLKTKVDRLEQQNKEIFGSDKTNLKTIVDRLQQTENSRKWAIKAITGSIVALIVERMWHTKW